ncbi:MAG: transglutaminase-like domain-containing protein [Pyrinomonadaceae bacterium]
MTPSDKLRAQHLRRQFAAVALLPDHRMELARSALLIGAEEQAAHPFSIEENLSQLEGMGARLAALLAAKDADPIEVFNRYFFDELGFAGNTENYYDPRNSMLHEVLARRSGIPITLSLVYMEIGRRAGLQVEGVGLPGHFIVRVKVEHKDAGALIDTFGRAILDVEDCQRKLDELYQGQLALRTEHLRAVSTREILIRMLANLKTIYQRQGMPREALAATERILLLAPDSMDERRDRGLLLAQLNRASEAMDELRLFLRSTPATADAAGVREQLRLLHLKLASLN